MAQKLRKVEKIPNTPWNWMLAKPSAARAGLRVALLSFDKTGWKAKHQAKNNSAPHPHLPTAPF